MSLTPDQVTYPFPGKLCITEHFFQVPLDHREPFGGRTIELFGRSVTRKETPITGLSKDEIIRRSQKPWMLYLAGGPGLPCSSPQNMSVTSTIINRGYRILYLDQRGTGLSSCITADTLAREGGVNKQVEYLKLFRADSIVRDCEIIRQVLTLKYPENLRKWSVIGSGFGASCIWTYLSIAPLGLREAFCTAGIPPIGKTVDDVYAATFKKLIKRNEAYFHKYPADKSALKQLLITLAENPALLPGGGTLTAKSFLGLGVYFGVHGGIDTVHEMVLRLSTDFKCWGFFTRPALLAFEALVGFYNHVIYSLLHESVYCSGPDPSSSVSNWAAQRIGSSLPEFEWLGKSDDCFKLDNSKKPAGKYEFGHFRSPPKLVYFSGEMIFPHMFEVYPELAPLRPVADLLAKTDDWPCLYDEKQLAENKVPVYAATFVEDMHVAFELENETLQKTANVKHWTTNIIHHDAMTSETAEVLEQMFNHRDDCIN